MIALLFTVSLPYLRAHAGRILLTLLGVIIGVQGMVAMGALNHSIIKSFEAGLEAIAGTARLQIAGPETGIPDALAEDALKVPGVESAVAIVDGSLTLPDDPTVRIRTFGIDLLGMVGTRSPQFPREHVHIADELRFVNATDSIALGAPLMARLGLALGDTVRLATPGGIRPYVVRGTLDDVGPTKLFGGLVALMDLPTAEGVFLSPGLAQTIYVSLKPDAALDDVFARLRTAIGDRARVERTEARGQQMDALLGSIRVALSLASLVTMIAAFFIIYETIAISVEQRRREIAIARSLGFTKGAVAGVFMLESLVIGLLGAAGGVAGGYLLARLSFTIAAEGISGMYFAVSPGEVSLPIFATALAAGTGVLTSMAGAIAPAIAAAREPVAHVLRGSLGITDSRLTAKRVGMGLGVLALAFSALTFEPRLATAELKTAWIMLGHALLIAGSALLAHPYAYLWSQALTFMASRCSLTVGLACDFFSRRPRRVASAASAIMVGYALVVVLGAVVASITGTLGEWITRTFGADITIGTPPGLNSGSFDSAVADAASRLPGVHSVERYRKVMLLHDGNPIILAGFDIRNRPDHQPLIVVRSEHNAYDAAMDGEGVFISESLAFRYKFRLRDELTLDVPGGTRSFKIVGVVRDFTMDLGTVLVDLAVYQEVWKDYRLTYAHIWPSPGADSEALRAQINLIARDQPTVTVVTNDEYRAEVDQRVNRLLRILGSLQVFACAIAVLGVVNFLLAAILDRRREIALLRSVGVEVRQIRVATMIEGSIIALVGSTLGLLAGAPAAYFMATHSLAVAMGWSLSFHFPTTLAVTTLLAVISTAAMAAYFPARRITSGTILAGLQME